MCGLRRSAKNMGVLYMVLPVNEETRPWLHEMVGDLPESNSRLPLIGEIYDTLNRLKGISFETNDMRVGQSWEAHIYDDQDPQRMWTTLRILACLHPSEPQEIYFAKCSPDLIFRVLVSLTVGCGTLALSCDGEDAFLIPPGCDHIDTYAEWLRLQNS